MARMVGTYRPGRDGRIFGYAEILGVYPTVIDDDRIRSGTICPITDHNLYYGQWGDCIVQADTRLVQVSPEEYRRLDPTKEADAAKIAAWKLLYE